MPPIALRALRHRNYRLFFSGQIVSLIGTWMQSVAQSWLIYRLTDSAFLLGLVGFATNFPVFFIAPFGGALADRMSRRRILLATQTASMCLAALLATFTLTGMIRPAHILVFASILGVINGFDIPARQAFAAELVGREDLANAIALNSTVFNAARVAGPAIAGLVVAAIGEGWCFAVNAASYVAVLSSLLLMRMTPYVRRQSTESTMEVLTGGFTFAGTTGPIRALLLLLIVISFTGMPYTVLMPIFASEILGGGARTLGVLMGATGVGALLGSIALATHGSVRGLGRWVARAALGFGVFLILFSYSRDFRLSVALLVPVGFSMVVSMASSNTLIQAMVPDAIRGRVMAVYSMVFMGGAPLGALLAGSLAETIGAPATVAAGGALSIVAAIVFRLRLPAHRMAARELILAQQMAGGEPAQEATAPPPTAPPPPRLGV
ncbi:MAG TPA: MFS transporter [Thermoanaerobaculia bacterium]|nr:MFS transporter [Thermoanaerobaculia bacterium]